jgi:uncharacterized membrane protein YhhN
MRSRTPHTRSLFVVYTLVTLLEIIGEETGNRWLHYGCKPLIMGLLLAWSWRQRSNVPGLRLLGVGMGFALLGDGLLMIREVDLFVPGLAAFLVMQVCYSVVFGRQIRATEEPANVPIAGLIALPFLLYTGTFYAALLPTFRQPNLAVLQWPVLAYALCLSTMGFMAALRRGIPRYGYVLLGALLFIASDSAIAVRAFMAPFPGGTPIIMGTYAAAQWLIVVYVHQPNWRRSGN